MKNYTSNQFNANQCIVVPVQPIIMITNNPSFQIICSFTDDARN